MTTETSTDVGAEVSRISTAEYLSSHGERCPYCGGAKIEWASSPGITAPAYMFIEMGCADCRKTWVTVWRLSSYVPAPITALMQHLESEQET